MGKFGYDDVKSVVFRVSDPGADNKQLHVWRAPQACEILRGYIACQGAQAAGSAGAFQLENWGTAGTATAGTIFSAAGGTAVSARMSAETPYPLTLVEGTLAAGEWVVLDYQETGDWVEVGVTICFDYIDGVGAA